MDYSTIPDESLMLSYGKGDVQAFEALYRRHKDSLYRYFVRQLSNRDHAHDLYQELWGKLINASTTYTNQSKWTTWAYRIAHNLVVDHYRSLRPVGPEEDVESVLHAPDRAHDREVLAGQLKRCMNNLPSVQLEVFILSQETDLTLKMISDVVNASHEAVKTRLRYARNSLKECLARFGLYPSNSKNNSGFRADEQS